MTTSKSVPSLVSVAVALMLAVVSIAGCGGSATNDGAGEQAVGAGSCAPIADASTVEQCGQRECCAELSACGASCQAFAQCLVGCIGAGTACSDGCGAQNPSGKDQYVAAVMCVFDKCAHEDAGDQ